MLYTQAMMDDVTLYRSGAPYNTEAVVIPIDERAFAPTDGLKYFDIRQEHGTTRLRYDLGKYDRLYGLGQQMGGLDKRGRRYRLFGTDKAWHTPDQEMMYGSHPFLMIAGRESFGFFLDSPAELVFDLGFTHKDVLEITIPSTAFDLYVFEHAAPKAVIRAYLKLTGASYVPPKWAFGYHQSRYGYKSADDIRAVAENFRKHDIPCDAIYFDIDYMQDYKVFSVNAERFPNFAGLTRDLQAEGIQPVPILDAAVRIETGYDVYDEGVANGYFCTAADGQPFVGGVWPGPSVFPDFLRAEVRAWWADKYRLFTDLGIHGFWNDMNEPAIFYTPEHLEYVGEEVKKVFAQDKMGEEFLTAVGDLASIFNRRDYYKEFYHAQPGGEAGGGERINHEQVHNLYGFNMARAAADGLAAQRPGQRYLLISRSSYAGLHRCAGIWTGDNNSWWEHLLLNIKMLASLNMIGLLYSGADIGGFGSNTSSELMIRWTQFGIFSPLCRNHTWLGARDQEPWTFDDECTAIVRDAIRLRYALLPYTYTEYMRAARDLEPLLSPLCFEFEGDRVADVEDQVLYGQSLMLAPIYESNARGRFVHLPHCRWLFWNAARWEDRQMTVLRPGDHYIPVELEETPIFVRENHLLVLAEPGRHVNDRPSERLYVIGLVTEAAEYVYYDDDGATTAYQDGASATLRIRAQKVGREFHLTTEKRDSDGYRLPLKEIHCELYDEQGQMFTTTLTV
jgi:alpha-glucosidase